MNFETLAQAWGKQTITATEVPVENVIAHLKAELRHTRRRFRGAMVIAIGLLLLGWSVTSVAQLTGIKRFTPLGFTEQVIDSLLYLALLVRATQGARTTQREMDQMGGTLRTSTAATLRTVELQIQNARIAAYALALVPALRISMMLAKYSAGEFPRHGVIWGTAAIAALAAMVGAAIWHRYRTRLVPRRTELRNTLRTLESEAAE